MNGVVSAFAPNLFREFNDHAKLGPLLFLREHIAFFGRGKAALRRERQLIQRHVFRGFLDTAFDLGSSRPLFEVTRPSTTVLSLGSIRNGSKPPARRPQISSASSTIIRSLAHCSSSARILPSSVEAKPHCGDRHSCSSGTYFAASSIRRLRSSLDSSRPDFDVTRPSTIVLSLGTKRSGSKPPARSLSYSMK